MIKNESTPTRPRTIMGEHYPEDFRFQIPQPFEPRHVYGVEELGASPAGVANGLNQQLAENLSNNMAAKVRAAVKNGTELPTQEDMDVLYESYDFSGTRSSAGGETLFDRIFTRLAGAFLKKLFKRKGYQDMSAPVTVAKKGIVPEGNQIDFDTFESEVSRLVEGNGPWGEVAAFIEVRNNLIEESRVEEQVIRNRQIAAESKLESLSQL